jgi:hypothetical protein
MFRSVVVVVAAACAVTACSGGDESSIDSADDDVTSSQAVLISGTLITQASATKLYAALAVPADEAKKEKFAGKPDLELGVRCRVSANSTPGNPDSCDLTVVTKTFVKSGTLVTSVSFGGAVAHALFDAMPEGNATVGATTKTVEGLTCVRTSGRGFPVTCTAKPMAATFLKLTDAVKAQLMTKQGASDLVAASF